MGKVDWASSPPILIAHGDIVDDSRWRIACIPMMQNAESIKIQNKIREWFPEVAAKMDKEGDIIPVRLPDKRLVIMMRIKWDEKQKGVSLDSFDTILSKIAFGLQYKPDDKLVCFPGSAAFGNPENWKDVRNMIRAWAPSVPQPVWLLQETL